MQRTLPEPRFLPVLPLWPGFALNTLFYAAIAWLLWRIPILIRRHRRRTRGLCLRCAYNRAGLAPGAPCPECGHVPGPVVSVSSFLCIVGFTALLTACTVAPRVQPAEVVAVSFDLDHECLRTRKARIPALAGATAVPEPFRQTIQDLVNEAIQRVPHLGEFVARRNIEILCIRSLPAYGPQVAGSCFHGDAGCISLFIPDEMLPFAHAWIPRVLYHELAHLVFSSHHADFPISDWSRCNPATFQYSGPERDENAAPSGTPSDPEREWSFVSRYSRVSIEEDFCEISAQFMMEPSKYARFRSSSPRIYEKCCLAMEVWELAAPGMKSSINKYQE